VWAFHGESILLGLLIIRRGSMVAQFLHIGDRILNVDAITRITFEGTALVNVHFVDGEMEQFSDAEALAIIAGLGPITRVIDTEE
jgi:hypothetical protein